MPGIPWKQSVGATPGTLWVHDDDFLPLHEGREAGHLLGVLGIPTATVEHDDERALGAECRRRRWAADYEGTPLPRHDDGGSDRGAVPTASAARALRVRRNAVRGRCDGDHERQDESAR